MVGPVTRDGRRSRRLHHDIPVSWRCVGGFLSDRATDISQCGMFINSRRPLPVGSTVRLIVQLPGAEYPCDLVGRVARVVRWGDDPRTPPGMGIEFTEVDREKQERIEAFVHSLSPALDPG